MKCFNRRHVRDFKTRNDVASLVSPLSTHSVTVTFRYLQRYSHDIVPTKLLGRFVIYNRL